MKNLKKLTILHSNDLHGDFLAKEVDKDLLGGISMLSGYIDKVRNEEKNVIYKSKNAQEAYTKWNVYIGRKKERPQRAEKTEN